MPQKTVILCEGAHDVSLISLLLKNNGKKVSSKTWDDILNAGKQGESNVISEFIRPRQLNSTYLVKQEKNIDTCVDSFWELYAKADTRYALKMVIDSDGNAGIRKVRNSMNELLSRDVLVSDENSPHIQYFKEEHNKPAIFLYPPTVHPSGKLTEMIKDAGWGNLAGCRDANERKEMLERYLATKPIWIEELETFLLA